MRALFVVVLEPRPQRLSGLIQCLEVVKPEALLFNRSDQPLDHTILLWRMGSDELLFQAIAADQCREVSACKNQAVTPSECIG